MANKQLNAVITIGGTVTSGLKNALGSTQRGLRQIGTTIRTLEREQNKLGKSIREAMNNGRPVTALTEKYRGLTAQIAKARHEQERMNRAKAGLDRGKEMIGRGGVMVGAAVAAAATIGYPIKQAADFETAMVGVAKQVQGARDKNGQLTQVYHDMAREIQLLGREMPIATNELASMAEAGARMGVAKEHLIDFTRTTGEMSRALKIDPAELGDSMGKIATLYKMPISAMREMGDAINYLDDQSVAKGGDIIDFLTRTGGVAGSVRVTGKEMAALGSTLLSLGERSETASTATNAMFQKLAAADKGTKKFRNALDQIGLSAGQLQKGMQVDAKGTVLQVIDAVNKLPKENRLGVLVDMFGLEHSDTIAKLAANAGELRKQIDLANSDAAQGSTKREADADKNTTNGRAIIAKNQFDELAVNIGTVLLPTVNQLLGVIGSVTSAMADWTREHPVLTRNILAVAGAITGVVGAVGAWKVAAGVVVAGFNLIRMAVMTNPIGLIITAIAVGAALIIANWEPIKAFFAAVWEGIKAGASVAWEHLKSVFLNATPLGLIIKNWGPISNFFSNLWNGIKSTVAGAVDWIMGKIAAVGNTWNTVKGWFGGGDSPKAAAPGGGGRMPPPAPRMATARGAGGGGGGNTFHITQQPGQSGKALADDVIRRLDARDRRGRGSILYDKPQG